MEDIKAVQNKILEIAVYLDEFCAEHGIEYYLMGGSALGAIRHNGFIPWDDDLDVFMTYGNYQKFIDVSKRYLDKEKFYLQEENTSEWPLFFTKLRMNNTTFIEEDTKNRQMHKGFYVDIMCLNNTTKNKVFRFVQYIAARIIVAKTLNDRGYITKSKIKKLTMFCTDKLVKGFVFNTLLWLVRSRNNTESKYVGHFFGRAKFKNTSFPKELLKEMKYVKFEDTKLPVMSGVHDYLSVRYGEKFMDIPDKKTRDLYPVHAIFTDTQKDYSFYESKYS